MFWLIRRQHVCLRDASDRPSGQQKEDNSYKSGADTGKILSDIINACKLLFYRSVNAESAVKWADVLLRDPVS